MTVQTVRVDDVTDIRRGPHLRPSDYRISQGAQGVPLVRLSDIDSSCRSVQYLSATRESLSDYKAGDTRVRLFPKGTVIFPILGPKPELRRIVIADVPVVASRGLVGLVPHPEVESRYLAWTLFHANRCMSTEAGPFNPGIMHLRTLKRFPIARRTLDEQTRIADTLDSADLLKSKCSNENTKVQRILQAVFLDIFGNPAATSSSWPTHRLEEVCEIVSASGAERSSSRQLEGKTDRLLLQNALKRDDLVVDESLGGQSFSESRNTSGALPPGAILLSTYPTVGGVAMSSKPIHVFNGSVGLVCRSSVDSWYLLAWLRLARPYLQSLTRDRRFSQLSPKILRNVDIPVPPLDLQHRFRSTIEHLHRVQLKLLRKERDLELIVHSLCADLLLDGVRTTSPQSTGEKLPL